MPCLLTRLGSTARIAAALVVLPPALAAQTPDSLVRLLTSADWHQRADGIYRLNALPANTLPASFGPVAVALLTREATTPNGVSPDSGEGYGEYETQLVKGVLRLHDPQALRGMALLGIQTGAAAKEFVASFGGAALPYLDEAWNRADTDRPMVVLTFVLMLGKYATALADSDQIGVRNRLLRAASDSMLAGVFATAAVRTPLPEALPLVQRIATTSPFSDVRDEAQNAAAVLARLRDQATPTDLVARLRTWVATFCAHPAEQAVGDCGAMTALSRDAANDLAEGRRGPAVSVLGAFADRVDGAVRAGTLTSDQGSLLSGTARYLVSRLDHSPN